MKCYRFSHYHLVPGFIDLHVHGANGCDVMDATPEALQSMSKTLSPQKEHSISRNDLTAKQMILKSIVAVRDFMDANIKTGAAILGCI